MDLTWRYSEEYRPSAPVVKASFAAFSLDLMVDTGFSGGIMLPFPIFRSLGFMSRLLPDSYSVVMPDARRVTAYTALCDATIGSVRVSMKAHSSPLLEKRLIGREALMTMIANLDGPRGTLTLSLGGH